MKIHGDVESEGSIQVDGQIEGDVVARTLTIGQSGQIMGTVKADTMHISGSIKGAIMGSFVKLGSSAVVNCEIAYRTLAVEEGAVLEGRCVRLDQNEADKVVDSSVPVRSAPAKRAKGKGNSKDEAAAA